MPREEGSAVRVDRLTGVRLEAREGGKLKFAIVKGPEGWELSQPYRDALDPRTRDALLEAVPDIWAERFLPADKAKSLDELGLKEPDRVLTVTRPDGAAVTLEVGKPILEGPPSNRSYARLKGFDRVFEINSDKLTPIYVSLDALRDNQLALQERRRPRSGDYHPEGQDGASQHRPGAEAGRRRAGKERVETGRAGSERGRLRSGGSAAGALSGLSATDKDVAEKVRLATAAAATTLPAMAARRPACCRPSCSTRRGWRKRTDSPPLPPR